MPGYHLEEIVKGKIGESSKILEEVQELIDAEQQGVRIMVLVELSDLIGAIEAYLVQNFPDWSMGDLSSMAAVTARAFRVGCR